MQSPESRAYDRQAAGLRLEIDRLQGQVRWLTVALVFAVGVLLVAIIILLISILIPSLIGSREQAKAAYKDATEQRRSLS